MNRDAIWAFAVAMFVLGDLVTTAIGIRFGLVENHVLYHDVSHDILIPLALAVKLVILAAFFFAYELVPEPARLGIPIGLALLGTAVTLWNSYLILSVV
jgi:hypothetical protein